MAYNFDGSTSRIFFDVAAFNGRTLSNFTYAAFIKTPAVFPSGNPVFGFCNSSVVIRAEIRLNSSSFGFYETIAGLTAFTSGSALPASTWCLLVFTHAAGTTQGRFHVHNGTSWSHSAGQSNTADFTVASNDFFLIAFDIAWGKFDMVCAGIKETNATDLEVETLSRTSFQAWRDFGFRWLVGLDPSLEVGGVLQDQGSPGTSDETGRGGITAVADPPGWSWLPLSIFIPQVVIT